MEGTKEIAKAYYQRASEVEKSLFNNHFRKMDIRGDGKISFTEYMKNLGPADDAAKLWHAITFKQMDVNGNGVLGFFDILTLYYIHQKKVIIVRTCNCCSCILLGPYFSCLLCLEKYPATYDLCCGCYSQGKTDLHEHSAEFVKDHHHLIMKLSNQSAQARTRKNSDLEELREIAKSYYTASSAEVQALAHTFFKSMDTDGDGGVNLNEFKEFMNQEGCTQMRSPQFFNELDQNNDGALDFWEVMTLYYIIKSKRPFCCGDRCGKFIPGVYFSCVECFQGVGSSFTLCPECYRAPSSRRDHTHDNGQAHFIDNYTLLETSKDPALETSTKANQNEVKRSVDTSNANVAVQRNYHAPYNYANVPMQQTYHASYTVPPHHPNYYNAYHHAPHNAYHHAPPPYTVPPYPPNYYNTYHHAPDTSSDSERWNWKNTLQALNLAVSLATCTIM